MYKFMKKKIKDIICCQKWLIDKKDARVEAQFLVWCLFLMAVGKEKTQISFDSFNVI